MIRGSYYPLRKDTNFPLVFLSVISSTRIIANPEIISRENYVLIRSIVAQENFLTLIVHQHLF